MIPRGASDQIWSRLGSCAISSLNAADAIASSRGETQMLDFRTDIDLDFELDEHGRVWMIREGDCHIIGRRDAVCAEMRRFLRTIVLGDDSGPPCEAG